MAYEWLYLAKFVMDSSSINYNHLREAQEVEASNRNKYNQASINNGLSVIAQLHVNEEDGLDLIKTGLEERDLKESIRREKAREAAVNASIGGGFGQSGQSIEASQLNIERHGFKALARKDLNREIRNRSFQQRRTNIATSTISKNNQLFSGLQIAPDTTGRNLEILSAGISSAVGSQTGIS